MLFELNNEFLIVILLFILPQNAKMLLLLVKFDTTKQLFICMLLQKDVKTQLLLKVVFKLVSNDNGNSVILISDGNGNSVILIFETKSE